MEIVKTRHYTPMDDLHVRLLAQPACAAVYTYDNHLPYLRACLTSIRKFDIFTILSYDNPFWGGKASEPLDKRLPQGKVLELADAIIMKHNTHQGGVTWPWGWHLKYITPLIKELEFEYAFITDGDSYYEKPENFQKLFKMMKKYDILSYWYNANSVGTQAWLCRVDALEKIKDYVADTFFKNFRSGNAESRLHSAVKDLGLKLAPTMKEYFDFRLPPDGERGLVGELLGLRHVHAEYKERRVRHLKPFDRGLIDTEYITSAERVSLEKYYETKDKKHLKQWWKGAV